MSAVTARLAVLVVFCASLAACASQPTTPPGASQAASAPVDVNARQGDGSTPLQWAGFLQQKPPVRNDLARILRNLGASVENPNLPPWPPVPTPTITAQVPE